MIGIIGIILHLYGSTTKFVCPSITWSLHFLVVMSSVAMNTCVHTFVWAYIFDSLVCSEIPITSDTWFANISLHSMDCLFTFVAVAGVGWRGECSQHGMRDLTLARDCPHRCQWKYGVLSSGASPEVSSFRFLMASKLSAHKFLTSSLFFLLLFLTRVSNKPFLTTRTQINGGMKK